MSAVLIGFIVSLVLNFAVAFSNTKHEQEARKSVETSLEQFRGEQYAPENR